jgi:hypothetical protein
MKTQTALAAILFLTLPLCVSFSAAGADASDDLEEAFFDTAAPLANYTHLTGRNTDAVAPGLEHALFDDAKSLSDYADEIDIPAAATSAKSEYVSSPSPLPVAEAAAAPVVFPHNTERVVLAEADPLSTGEMGALRGGFIDPTGLILNFAVNVQTDINGAQIFTRSFTVSPLSSTGALQAVANANLLPKNLPANLSLGLIGNGQGVAITNPNGQTTTVLNQTATGAPASIVLNTSNNTTIAQSVAVTLALKNLSSISNFARSATQSALAQHTALRGLGF